MRWFEGALRGDDFMRLPLIAYVRVILDLGKIHVTRFVGGRSLSVGDGVYFYLGAPGNIGDDPEFHAMITADTTQASDRGEYSFEILRD